MLPKSVHHLWFIYFNGIISLKEVMSYDKFILSYEKYFT